MNNLPIEHASKYKRLILAVSILIPLVVGALFRIRIEGNLSFLPPAIRKHQMALHRSFVRMALLLSILFLACYVAYHLTSDPTYYGDFDKNGSLDGYEVFQIGGWRYVYWIILGSHIGLSMVVIPLVLNAYLYAWMGDYAMHKKLVKAAFPIWLYVAITGVVVYFMISPFY
jgi:putative membrane protein